ncbi:MAG: DUF4912 domain-containing protein [Planctomycetes bacterium]|nr:DUF4912 domain-containing protein [Planctomycetota bacterium]
MTPEQLMGMSVKELKVLAGEKGVAHAAKMRKDELVKALLPHSRGPHPGSPSTKTPAGGTPILSEIAPSGSSSMTPPAARPPQVGPDPGLPIPDRYGRDRLVLMVQDPQHIFAYWEVTPERLEQARHAAGESSTPVLVLMTASGNEQREVDLRGGNYYLAVAPNSTYQAQIALRDRSGKLHPLAVSNQVSTPAASVSARQDEQWMAVDETFHELLSMAGLPGQVRPDSSTARFTDQRLAAWAWKETGVKPFSSGSLSSHTFSSLSLTVRDLEPTKR